MKIRHIYSDKDGILRACVEPVPVEPKACSEQTIEHYKAYQSALQHCKDSSVPFTSQEDIKDYMWRHDQRINGPIPILYWWENMMKKDTFYPCEVEVEIHEACGHDSCNFDAECEHCKEPIELARLSPVAPEPSLEKPDLQEDDYDVWCELGNEINKLYTEMDPIFGVHPILDLLRQRKQFTITRKKENN